MREHKAHFTSPLIPLSSACTDCLNRAGSSDSDIHRDGGVSKGLGQIIKYVCVQLYEMHCSNSPMLRHQYLGLISQHDTLLLD